MATELVIPIVIGLANPFFGAAGKIWGKPPITNVYNNPVVIAEPVNQKRDGYIEPVPLRLEQAPVPEDEARAGG